MNSLLALYEREHGISNNLNYDFALSRLCVKKDDSWKGITPSTYGSDYNPEPPIFSAKFANCKNYHNILAIANEDGKIALQDTNVRNEAEHTEVALEGKQCHFNAVFDLEWVPGQMKFVSASGDHTARLWDITETEIRSSREFRGHTRSVKTAAFRKNDSAVFATGGRDGAILIWDTRASLNFDLTSRADNCIYSGHAGGPSTPVSQKKRTRATPKISANGASSSITGLVFQDDFTLISCGAGDGIIKVWDLRRNYTCYKKEPLPKYSLPYAGSTTFKGFTNLLVDSSGVRLYANCMDNTIYCYNLSSYSTIPMQKYVGLRNSTFYIKSCLSPDDNYLISGSSDEKAYVWNVNNPNPLVALNGHTVEVTCVAWSRANDMPIVTCSDDARHKIWRIGPEKIEIDEKVNFRGVAEFCSDYKERCVKNRLKCLEFTPRSLRRHIERNEKTPSSVEKSTLKRTFSEMISENGFRNYHHEGSDQKRPHFESRGRRLFSPPNSSSINDRSSRSDFQLRSLDCILEETEPKSISPVSNNTENSNQENSPLPSSSKSTSLTNGTSEIRSPNSSKSVAPLTERTEANITVNGGTPVLSRKDDDTVNQKSLGYFSPTSNLPNYVIDGEAPHLCTISPKRNTKEKIDWLTKFRKQKLLSGRSSSILNEKLNFSCVNSDNEGYLSDQELCLSPRLQSLKASETSPKTDGVPKRRMSRSGSNSDLSMPRLSTGTRRNSETSILRFFTIASPSQCRQQHDSSSQCREATTSMTK